MTDDDDIHDEPTAQRCGAPQLGAWNTGIGCLLPPCHPGPHRLSRRGASWPATAPTDPGLAPTDPPHEQR